MDTVTLQDMARKPLREMEAAMAEPAGAVVLAEVVARTVAADDPDAVTVARFGSAM